MSKDEFVRGMLALAIGLVTLAAFMLLSGCNYLEQGIKCIDGKAWTQSNVNPEVYYPTDKTCMVIK